MSKQIILWDKSTEHDQRTEQLIDKKRIYNEKQNYPELVVEDIIEDIMVLIEALLDQHQLFNIATKLEVDNDAIIEAKNTLVGAYRNQIYAILLKRGVNKWFFVRKLLIRLKKKYQYKIGEVQRILEEDKERYKNLSTMYDALSNKDYWKLKGELKAYTKIREELMLLCNSPRWVIWNYKKVGLVDTVGLQRSKARKWYKLFSELTDRRFKK